MGRVEDLPEAGLNMSKGGQIHVLGWAFFAAYTVVVRDDPKSSKKGTGLASLLRASSRTRSTIVQHVINLEKNKLII